jgi:hypothetical protein
VLGTILLSLVFGIACGYAAIHAILHALGRRPAKQEMPPASVVVATTVSSS